METIRSYLNELIELRTDEIGNGVSIVYSIMYRQGLMDGIHITALIDEGRRFDNEFS